MAKPADIKSTKHRAFWSHFAVGFVRGFGSVFGIAVAIIFIGFLAAILGGLPVIGNIIRAIGDAARFK